MAKKKLRALKTSPLTIAFITWDDAYGSPLNTGLPARTNQGETVVLNLKRPQLAKELISYGRTRGWMPERRHAPLHLEHGLEILAQLGYELDLLHP